MVSVAALVLGLLVGTALGANNEPASTSSGMCDVGTAALKRELGSICEYQTTLLNVRYGSDEFFLCDETSSKLDTSSQPTEVRFDQAEAGKTYTLLMVDPDAPNHSLESLEFYLHWAVTDITGENLRRGIVQGTTLIDYHGPRPPFGIHRYQLVVFDSTTGVHLTDQHRGHFSLLNFVNVNSSSLCSVVAVFQFRVPA